MVKILKFGGTSVADAEMMRRVAEIVRDRRPCVVVTSAIEGVTDMLEAVLPEAVEDEEAVAPVIRELRERHVALVDDLDAGARDAVVAEIDRLIQRLERVLYGVAYTQDLTPKTRDLALSFGERLAARALAAHLRNVGIDAEALDGDEAGIVTDDSYGSATPLLPEIEENVTATIAPRLRKGLTPVVTGFFGISVDGHVTTFGRGGSDFTGAVLAAALDADALEVWTDVDGFLTSDPSQVADARPVAEMTYEEAAELAYTGIRVLHPRTVEPLAERGIPIEIRNTRRPDAGGTTIHDVEAEAGDVRAVAVRDGLGVVKIYGPGMAATPGIGKKVFTALGDRSITVYNMAASQASFALLMEEDDVAEAGQVIRELRDGIIQDVETTMGKSLVCIVGPDLGSVPGIAGRLLAAVGDAGVNVEMISVGATPIAMNFVVDGDDEQACLEALHEGFLG